MKINRHNYEEFFLLYVDNELQPEERKEVENFVAQNLDLSEELMVLQQTILPEADIFFTEKNVLYKKEEGISLSNYETFFLLYVDKELTGAQNEKVETFVLQHPQLQNDFTLLKKTVAEPESIVFKGKESLYRSEKTRRIVPLIWLRMGVAAAILGLIALVWIFTQNSSVVDKVLPVTKTKKERKKVFEKINQPAVTNETTASLQQRVVAEKKGLPNIENTISAPQKKIEKNIPRQQLNDVAVEKKAPIKQQENEDDENPVVVNEKAMNQPDILENNEQKQVIAKQENTNDQTKDDLIKQARTDDKPALVSNAVYREIDTSDDDRSLYIGSASINKNKLKGLFKKAARLLGKASNNTDDEK